MITKDMTILDIVNKYPETIDVFQAYDKTYSTCICCTSLFETLENTASMHKLDLVKLLSDLNKTL
ncbi:DUF1858 domain-containing protein [Phosphitispora sp. TUW77]|uniref:DUF1858 domain-containing protein n=1 Tax=Phosphitispora sp. TUW77 TaxID=3152361 RepID=UPI003AB16BB1